MSYVVPAFKPEKVYVPPEETFPPRVDVPFLLPFKYHVHTGRGHDQTEKRQLHKQVLLILPLEVMVS